MKKLRILALSGLAAIAVAGLQAQDWTIGPFTRPASGNPAIAPQTQTTFADPVTKQTVHWEALHTFNPAAIVRDGKVYVLYRAEDDTGTMEIGGHTSRLGLAESADGIHFTRAPEPVFYPAEDSQKAREWPGGVEDPRIVELEDGTYVLTYTQWNRVTYSVGIATSKDLEHWTKHGPAFAFAAGGKYADLKYKSAGIVTRLDRQKGRLIAAKIDDRYWMYWGEGSIHIARSDDAIHWTPLEGADGKPVEVLQPRPGHFDSSFPETGPPPVLTDKGIVVLYNGKNAPKDGDKTLGPNAYAAGEALFDPDDPIRRIAQTDAPVLKPELPYEKTGQYAAGTTFAEGLVYFHDKWFLYYGCADSLVAVAMAPGPKPPAGVARGFYLHPDDSVVFYGDSITEQNYFNQWVELYTVTRFPRMRVHFFDAGVGGDRVTGGSGGPIDLRLQRDVFNEKPSVIAIMLGMNDGEYRATTPEIEAAYRNGYEHILDSIHEHAPDARVTLLGPSPYDDVTAAPYFPGGYNSVMQHFAGVDEQLAQEHGATFVNLNPPVVSALEKAEALDPRLAKLLLPDRVHPDPLAHWVMAEAILKEWNAPAVVSSVIIDASAGVARGSGVNATVADLTRDGNTLRWSEKEDALPLPLTRDNATQKVLFDLTDIEKALDEEPLTVSGLEAGRYVLAIDGNPVGTFTDEELKGGVNLADFPTPMFHQAQRVSWMVRDRDEAYYIHLRMRVRNADTGAENGADRMHAFEDSLEDSIYAEAAPVPHEFELRQVEAPTAQGAE